MSYPLAVEANETTENGQKMITTCDETFIAFCLTAGCKLAGVRARGRKFEARLVGGDLLSLEIAYYQVCKLCDLSLFGYYSCDLFDTVFRMNKSGYQTVCEKTEYVKYRLSAYFTSCGKGGQS